MSSYHDEERALTKAVQDTGPLYAAEFGKLTGKAWRYDDPTKGGEDTDELYARGYALTEAESGIVISLYASKRDGKATASPSLPNMPSGGANPTRPLMRDLGVMVDGARLTHTYECGVSWDRFLTEVPACARRFVKLVYAPYKAVFPQIQAYIAGRADGYTERDKVAAELAAEFHGQVRGDGSRVTVYFPDSRLASIEVGEGGHIRMTYAPGFNAYTLRAYFNACLAQRESAQ